MTSKSRATGNTSVRVCKQYFESQGAIFSKAELGGKFTKYKDLFSEFFDTQLGVQAGFDAIALDTKYIWLIQITTTRPKTHTPCKCSL